MKDRAPDSNVGAGGALTAFVDFAGRIAFMTRGASGIGLALMRVTADLHARSARE